MIGRYQVQLPLLHPSTISTISTMVKNCDKLPWLKDALTHHYSATTQYALGKPVQIIPDPPHTPFREPPPTWSSPLNWCSRKTTPQRSSAEVASCRHTSNDLDRNMQGMVLPSGWGLCWCNGVCVSSHVCHTWMTSGRCSLASMQCMIVHVCLCLRWPTKIQHIIRKYIEVQLKVQWFWSI